MVGRRLLSPCQYGRTFRSSRCRSVTPPGTSTTLLHWLLFGHDLRANAFRICREGKLLSTLQNHAVDWLSLNDKARHRGMKFEKGLTGKGEVRLEWSFALLWYQANYLYRRFYLDFHISI